MPVRRATRAAAVALLLLSSMTVASTAPAGAQAAGPAVTVSPTDDLVEGQPVTVSGTGYPGDTVILVRQCEPRATGIGDCEYTEETEEWDATTDADGTFTIEIPVSRFVLRSDETTVDCAALACSIGIGIRLTTQVQFVPITFAEVPLPVETVTVTPATDLVDGQPVTVTGTGHAPRVAIILDQCGPDATVLSECASISDHIESTGRDGTFTYGIDVARFIERPDGTTIDCAAVPCSIGVQSTRDAQFVPISFADHPLPTGTVTVTPSTDLLHEQLVELHGTDFVPGISLTFGVCRSGATDLRSRDCWAPSVTGVSADTSGEFTDDVPVVRFLDGDDCVDVACAIVGFTGSGHPLGIEVPISFADVPSPLGSVEVRTSGLVDGTRATVVGTGFPADTRLHLSQCPAAPTSPDDCSHPRVAVRTDEEGGWTTELEVSRILRTVDGPMIDCAVETCTVGVPTDPRVPVSGALDVVDPVLTVDLDPDATLLAGTDEVVAQLTVSCDIATPVSVRATVSQPGIEGRWDLGGRRCTPDHPLLVFVPVYAAYVEADDGAAFALGEARLTTRVAELAWFVGHEPPSASIGASGTIQLHDHASVVAAVQAAVADPDNTELRAEVLRAISVRLRQDPVFRAEWPGGMP